jgi:beta-lactam-binding protein with PASTA domain
VPSPGPFSLIGRVLDGRYRVLSHLADGGMATVYIALDLRLDRQVALKVMRADLAKDESFVEKFRREARSAARLSHPNVVAVFDQGEDDGQVFLAMELVNGLTLRQVMHSEGPLTARAALDIIDPVLQALGAAHNAGLIHRDVKPENVILRDDGTVKVADFGLARAISTTSTAQTGLLLGTVAYLSPEQVERGVADARSDVYAAGLVLFEMLTGTKAFIGDSPIHVAYQHVHSEVPLASSRLDTVPAGLDRLVARASARDPERRPRDANELLAEVRRVRQTLSSAELDQRPRSAGAAPDPTIMLSPAAMAGAASRPPGPGSNRFAGRWNLPDVPFLRERPWQAALVAGLLVVAAAALLFFTVGPGATTTVPVVKGSTRIDAEKALALAHLDTKVVSSFDETTRVGVVLLGEPPAGREVRRGSTVTLTVSKGPERYSVPQVAGRTQADAQQRIIDQRLTVGPVSKAYNETVPEGQVISTSPAADTMVKRASEVTLVISQGRQPIKLEDYTGQPVDQAVKAMTDAELKVDATKHDWSDTVPKDYVISQSPATGTLFTGGLVTLVVSKGPQLVPVPDVVGQQEQNARAALQGLGFKVKVDRVLGGFFGTVRDQSIPGGTKAPAGSTITLTLV